MSSHYQSSHNGGSHYLSSHYGRGIVAAIVRRIRDFAARITRTLEEEVRK